LLLARGRKINEDETEQISHPFNMKLEIDRNEIVHSQGRIAGLYPVTAASEIGGRVLVLYDYMAFPHGSPARNLFAYDLAGNQLWRAEDIGLGATDGYTNFITDVPLVVGNFAGAACTIDPNTGKVLNTVFTK